MKHRAIITVCIGLLLCLFFIPTFLAAEPNNAFSQVIIANESDTYKFNVLVEVPVPPQWVGLPCYVMNEADKTSSLPFIRKTTESRDLLLVQISLAPYEEKKMILKKGESSERNKPQIVISNSPGTDFLFVNYKQAIIISTEKDNEVQFFSNEGKQFLPEMKPLVLDEGKSYILQTTSPQLVQVKSAKPIYIYASSMNYQKDNSLMEAGDSDTTTLFTNFGYIYVFKHVWISAYKDTKVNIFDQNGRNVFSKALSANSGLFKDDLDPGAYKVTSDYPVTIQTGYLDDENFSFIHGHSHVINGFSFGDLLVQSLYPETTIQINWENQEKNKHKFKQSAEIEIFKSIQVFNPKKAEYRFFSLQSSHPVKVCSFSSGNNFGGEFITGTSSTHKDDRFEVFTTRVSKEFSKEQRNLIELIGLNKDTNVVVSGSVNKKMTLQENTHFDLPSSTPLDKISITSDADLLICQLHNYTNKGLFYIVPPLLDSTISIVTTDTIGEGIFQEIPNERKQWINWFRISESLKNSVHVPYLPLTLFFIGIIGILITALLISLNKLHPSTYSDKEQDEFSQNENSPTLMEGKKENIPIAEGDEISPAIEKTEKPALKLQIPNLGEPSESFVYPTLPKTEQISKFKPIAVSLEKDTENQDELLIPEPTQVSSTEESFIKTPVVLDPGSANRLFYEDELKTMQNAYIASLSAKKLPLEIHDYLKKIDLNLQDQTRISNLLRSLPIREESARAIAICKKMKISVYISSYPLPNKILDILVIPVSEWKQSSLI